jgi:hypothetical protein
MIAVDSPVLVELLSNRPQADAVEANRAEPGRRAAVVRSDVGRSLRLLRGGAEVLEALEEMVPVSTRWLVGTARRRCTAVIARGGESRSWTNSWSAPTHCCSATA